MSRNMETEAELWEHFLDAAMHSTQVPSSLTLSILRHAFRKNRLDASIDTLNGTLAGGLTDPPCTGGGPCQRAVVFRARREL
jgi:hypothetical protein